MANSASSLVYWPWPLDRIGRSYVTEMITFTSEIPTGFEER